MDVTGKTRIYRKDFNGRPAYSRMISSKRYVDGVKTDDWIRTYQSVQLPKGDELQNKVLVNVTNGFETCYEKKDGSTDTKLIIMDYDVIEEGLTDVTKEVTDWKDLDEDIPF